MNTYQTELKIDGYWIKFRKIKAENQRVAKKILQECIADLPIPYNIQAFRIYRIFPLKEERYKGSTTNKEPLTDCKYWGENIFPYFDDGCHIGYSYCDPEKCDDYVPVENGRHK